MEKCCPEHDMLEYCSIIMFMLFVLLWTMKGIAFVGVMVITYILILLFGNIVFLFDKESYKEKRYLRSSWQSIIISGFLFFSFMVINNQIIWGFVFCVSNCINAYISNRYWIKQDKLFLEGKK